MVQQTDQMGKKVQHCKGDVASVGVDDGRMGGYVTAAFFFYQFPQSYLIICTAPVRGSAWWIVTVFNPYLPGDAGPDRIALLRPSAENEATFRCIYESSLCVSCARWPGRKGQPDTVFTNLLRARIKRPITSLPTCEYAIYDLSVDMWSHMSEPVSAACQELAA